MSTVPEDIMAQILSYLPVKSLLRYRSVCSSWLDLIDSPNFINHHLSRNTCSISKIILTKRPDYIYHDFDLYNFDFNSINQPHSQCRPGSNPSISRVKFSSRRKPIGWKLCCDTIISSINGLVCIFNYRTTRSSFIFNPSTRRYQKLPRLPDEKVYTYGFGFGFDKLNNDYKVVLNAQLRNSLKIVVLVYVLRTNLWTTLEFTLDNVSFKTHKTVCCGVFVSGSIHWIVSRLNERSSGNRSSGPNVIAAFDLTIEEYGFMLLPECSNTWDEYAYTMNVLQGCLCLSYGYGTCNDSGTNVDVFVMKEYGVVESWTKLYVIQFGFRATRVVWLRALSLDGGHHRVFLEHAGMGLLWYDLENKSIEHIKLTEEDVVNSNYFRNFVAVSESLEPLTHPRWGGRPKKGSKRKRTQLLANPRSQA